jgi:alkylated DNA repair dioxygenase AlkB
MHYQHITPFLTKQEADYLYSRLLKEIPWTQVKYYKPERGYIITPRLTWVAGFHQKKLYPLDYHGGYIPNEIPPWLCELKDVIEEYLNQKYNFILFSWYRDENDFIAYHSDNENFLGYNPNIASISVGGNRPFCLKNKITNQIQSFNLNHGDLFVMQNNCQRDYLHSIPKQSYKCTPRLSLTFRNALNETGSKNYYHYNLGKSIF